MNNLLKYSQLARALDVNPGIISMAVKRGKLEKEERKKLIDIEKPINILWINKQVAEGKDFDLRRVFDDIGANLILPKIKKEDFEPIYKKPEEKPKRNNKYDKKDDEYVKKKREYELRKLKSSAEENELKVQKLNGELIPYDAVKTVFLYAVETIRNTYQQEVDALANVFIRRLKGNHDNFVELQKELSFRINEIQKQAKDNLLQGLKGIQAEYKEVRNRGEKK